VTFTAQGQGSPFPYQYRFDWYDGTKWTTVQPYSSVNTWTMPASTPIGSSYWVAVYVRTSPLVASDAVGYLRYAVNPTPATGVTITSSVPSPSFSGTAVTFTAQGQGSTGPYQYRFDWYDGTKWTTVQPYSATNTWTMPSSTPIGSGYWVAVYVRTTTLVASDAVGYMKYAVIANNPPATGLILTTTPPSPSAVGTTVTVTAQGQGSTGYQYRFDWYDGTKWNIAQPFSATNTWTLPNAPAGSYWVAVFVRTTPNVAYDQVQYVRYTFQ
jgi:uncharacterized protein YcfL